MQPVNFDLLPPSLRLDDRSRAFLAALWLTTNTDLSVILVYNLDLVSESALLDLGWQFDVLGYKGMFLARNAEEQRELLKIAFDLHRYAGSRYAIKRALAWLGFDQSFEVVENPSTKYDGLSIPAQDGTQTFGGSRVGEFAVFTSGSRGFNINDIALIVKLIETWKPLSRRLFDLYINDIPVFRQLRLYDGEYFYNGAIDHSGYELAVIPRL